MIKNIEKKEDLLSKELPELIVLIEKQSLSVIGDPRTNYNKI